MLFFSKVLGFKIWCVFWQPEQDPAAIGLLTRQTLHLLRYSVNTGTYVCVRVCRKVLVLQVWLQAVISMMV